LNFLIVDVGSSSVRALLYDGYARPAPGLVARRPHAFITGAHSAVTADFEALASRIEECIDEALHISGTIIPAAVGMAAFAGSLVGLDARGRPVTPVYTYADRQCAADAAALTADTDAAAAHQRTGCRIHPAYQPARLRWLRRAHPQAYAQVAQWCDVSSALYRRWFGRPTPISHSAAAWSGLLNRRTLAWDAEWLTLLALDERRLPLLADWRTAQHGLTAAFARRWPTLATTPFFPAVGDGAAANLGSGGGDGAPVLTLGTTGAIRLLTAAPREPLPGALWDYCLDRDRRLLGGATTEGGSTADWCRNALGLTIDELRQSLSQPPDGHGLTALPLFAGERSPGWRDSALGTIHGLRPNSTRLDMAQTLLESVGLRLRHIAGAAGVRGQPLWAGGGALESLPEWASVLASAIGSPLRLIDECEPTARGVALMLAEQLTPGFLPQPPALRTVLAPDPAAASAYDVAAERQTALYRALYGQV
jgi:gluconokinase